MENDIQVLIIASNPLARTGLAAILEAQGGFQIIGQIDPAQVDDVEIYDPDILVWDVGEGIPQDVGYPVVALIPDADQAAIAWAARPQGLLLRRVETESLIQALRAATSGLIVLAPELLTAVLPAQDTFPELIDPLTSRELDVLQLLAEGLSNKAIALDLKISDHTVKFHVNAIMTKLNAQSRTEAAVRATRMGLIMI